MGQSRNVFAGQPKASGEKANLLHHSLCRPGTQLDPVGKGFNNVQTFVASGHVPARFPKVLQELVGTPYGHGKTQ